MLMIDEETYLEEPEDEEDRPVEELDDEDDELEEPRNGDDESEEDDDNDEDGKPAEEPDDWKMGGQISEPQDIQEVYTWVTDDFFEDKPGEEPANEDNKPRGKPGEEKVDLTEEPDKGDDDPKRKPDRISEPEEQVSHVFEPLYFTPDRGKGRDDFALKRPHGTNPAVIGGRGTGEPGSRGVFLRAR